MIEAIKALLVSLFLVASPAGGDTSANVSGSSHVARTMSVLVPLVAKWEGLSLTPYRDIVGVLTWCYGETEGTPKASYTEAECSNMLRSRLMVYHSRLLPYFTDDTRALRLPPKRHAAFDSLSYNVGTAGAGKSTAVRRLNAGNIAGACQAITWWNRAGQRVIRGLVNRRAEEKELCLVGV